LAALLAATVVVPVTQGALAADSPVGNLLSSDQLPTTVGVLTAQPLNGQVPASLQPVSTVAERDLVAASRGLDRAEILPGCDGHTPTKSSPNGQMPASDLCTLWDGHTQVRADYAVALAQLNQAYVQRYGVDMCFTDGYRSLARQYEVARTKGYLAAVPGTSNHGLGLAVDICSTTYAGTRYQWLRDNGPTYGIDNPEWARTTKKEPWHWEFTDAVKAASTSAGTGVD